MSIMKQISAEVFLGWMAECSAVIPVLDLLDCAAMYGLLDARVLATAVKEKYKWQIKGEGYSEVSIRGGTETEFLNENKDVVLERLSHFTRGSKERQINPRIKWVEDFLCDHKKTLPITKDAPILDVGTFVGESVFLLAIRNPELYFEGLEPNHTAYVAGSDMNNTLNLANILQWHFGTLQDLPLDKKYSVVSIQEVLEHVVNPRMLIDDALLRLTNNGYIIGSVPTGLWEKDVPINERGHIHQFTPDSLIRLFGPRMNTVVTHIVTDNIYAGGWLMFEACRKNKEDYEKEGKKLF